MSKSSHIQVVLVRTGRTEWDDAGRVQGRTDLPLSPSGRQAVAASLRDLLALPDFVPPVTVYTAPDEASTETARMLAEGCGARLRTEEDLVTMDLGLWEGLLESEIAERFPSASRQWEEQPSSVNPPQGESFDEAEQRIRLAMARLLDKANGKPVAFVLRPLPFAMAVCRLADRSFRDIWPILEDGPPVHRLAVPRDQIRRTLEEFKARA